MHSNSESRKIPNYPCFYGPTKSGFSRFYYSELTGLKCLLISRSCVFLTSFNVASELAFDDEFMVTPTRWTVAFMRSPALLHFRTSPGGKVPFRNACGVLGRYPQTPWVFEIERPRITDYPRLRRLSEEFFRKQSLTRARFLH